MTWNAHIVLIAKKVAPAIGILTKLSTSLSTKVFEDVYFALVHSKIEYAAIEYAAIGYTRIAFKVSKMKLLGVVPDLSQDTTQ